MSTTWKFSPPFDNNGGGGLWPRCRPHRRPLETKSFAPGDQVAAALSGKHICDDEHVLGEVRFHDDIRFSTRPLGPGA